MVFMPPLYSIYDCKMFGVRTRNPISQNPISQNPSSQSPSSQSPRSQNPSSQNPNPVSHLFYSNSLQTNLTKH